ncbi:DUF4402 domain-containing protein [Sphingomonas crusticola]|uniref:DUF4402 domain-containing protein n=1 Tax=Sphingomonas crusticola TaxID=1697973 RepID=UPI000E236940|nr:DUF4402 domain-containing protein [Sphingomonas crusticola]
MTNIAKIALGLLVAVTPAQLLAQQTSASADATASVTLLQPITLTKVLDMKFGKIVRSTNGNPNVIAITSAGARSISGSGNGILVVGPVFQQAQFTVGGEGSSAITVSVPASFTMGTLTVTTSGIYPAVIDGAYGSQGTATVNVGGSITVAPTTPTGTYTGTFTVTASYN